MDTGLPSPARVTFSLLNGYSVAINLGTIVTSSPGVFRLYTRCPAGWCYVTSYLDGNGNPIAVAFSASITTTCVSAAAAPLGVGAPVVLYSNATVATVTTPTTGTMWSLYGQYRDESCHAILRVALNWAGQPTRSLWVRQVQYASSLPWTIGPSAGLVVSVRNGFSYTIDMGYFAPGAPTMFKLYYLVNSVWTEPSDYTLLSGNCLPSLPVAPVAAGYPVTSVSTSTASWGQLGSPFGSLGGLALRDTACRVAVQLTMSSSYGPLQQVYVLKNVNLPVDQDPYAAYGLVRNGETTVLSLGVIPLNSTTIGLYLPADNGTLWPVPQSSGAIQAITVGSACSPSGVGAAAVYWYSAARRRSRRALAAADDAAAAPLSSAQLAASFEAGISSALGLPPGSVSVTVTTLPSLSSPTIRALYAVYLDLPGTVQEPYSAGFDDGTGQPLPAAVAAALGALTGKPLVPAAIAAGELAPVDADGFPTYWASSDGSEPDPSASQISVHVTIPSELLALPRSQWPEALQAAIPVGSSDHGAAIAAALSSPRISAALAAQGLPASAVTLPSSSSSGSGGQGAWSAPVTAGTAPPAGPSSGTDGGASSWGGSSKGDDSSSSGGSGTAPAAGLVAGAAIGAAAAVALASGLIVLAVRRAAAPRVSASKLPVAEDSSSSPGRGVSASSDPVAVLDPVSRCDTSGDAAEAPGPALPAASEPLTHIVTGSLSPTSGRFTVTSAGAFRASAAAATMPLSESMGAGGGAAVADALAAAGSGDDGAAAPASSRRAAVVPLPAPGSADTPDSDAFMPEAAPGDLDGAVPHDLPAPRFEQPQRRILEEDRDAAHVDTPTSLLFTRSFKAPGTGALAASAAAADAWAIADLDGAAASLTTGDCTDSEAAALASHPFAVPPSAAEEAGAASARMLLSHVSNPSTPSRKAAATPRSPEVARY